MEQEGEKSEERPLHGHRALTILPCLNRGWGRKKSSVQRQVPGTGEKDGKRQTRRSRSRQMQRG